MIMMMIKSLYILIIDQECDSTKVLITSHIVAGQPTNAAAQLALVNNVNDNYLHSGELLSVLLESNTIGNNTTCESKAKDDCLFEEYRITSRIHEATIQYEKDRCFFKRYLEKQKCILVEIKQKFDTMMTPTWTQSHFSCS